MRERPVIETVDADDPAREVKIFDEAGELPAELPCPEEPIPAEADPIEPTPTREMPELLAELLTRLDDDLKFRKAMCDQYGCDYAKAGQILRSMQRGVEIGTWSTISVVLVLALATALGTPVRVGEQLVTGNPIHMAAVRVGRRMRMRLA